VEFADYKSASSGVSMANPGYARRIKSDGVILADIVGWVVNRSAGPGRVATAGAIGAYIAGYFEGEGR
jgi:hypothetical protein